MYPLSEETFAPRDQWYVAAWSSDAMRQPINAGSSTYLRELYQRPGIGELTDFAAIMRVYFGMRQLNPTGIVPAGPANMHPHDAHDRHRVGIGLTA